ncbi:SIR2 family protein [Alkanindiges sp. WGS2144]|uniref:SIR2 family protein n=1 Tax=Alkanindiges sp. WGS2144 TaxID=3366808 RepID=UPI00375201E4
MAEGALQFKHSDNSWKELEIPEGCDDAKKEEIEANRQKLSDILLQALQMPNLAFFAGSGTSLGETNAPSMWKLWQFAMVTNPDDKECEELTPEAERIVSIVNYSLMKPNIEHFLSNCDAYLNIYEDDTQVKQFIIEVKKIILNKCTLDFDETEHDISTYEQLINKLSKRRARDPRLKVFTTNYDMCFETAASNLGKVVVDGFSYTRERKFDGKYFQYDIVQRDSEKHDFIEGIFQLYKLHGSVSWERSEANPSEVYEKLNPDPERAAIIYPAKNKYQQAFIQPHLELLARFFDYLRLPNACLVVSGFGFKDDHLSEPICAAIKSNPSLKLIIADIEAYKHIENLRIDSSSYWQEFKNLAEKGADITFVNADFKDFVVLIPDLQSLTPAEKLAKAVQNLNRRT